MMKSIVKRALGAGSAALFSLQMKMYAFAEGSAGGADWLKDSPTHDPFGDLTTTVEDWGRSGYKLMMAVGIALAVIFGIAAAIKIMSGDRQAKNEGKSGLLWVLVGAAILGSILAIVGLFMNLGASAFGG